MVTRTLLVSLLVAMVAGCGTADSNPCGSVKGACIALSFSSKLPLKVDALRVYAFGQVKTASHKPAVALPVGEALTPPAGVTGEQSIGVEALLNGAPVGTGETTVNVTGGHVAATVALAAPVAGACPSGFLDCAAGDDGCETFANGDPQHCGACDQACSFANTTAGCAGGACTIGTCTSPWADCNGMLADGCESDLTSNAAHCGDCGTACGLVEICDQRRCQQNIVNCTSTGATCSSSVCSSGRFAVDDNLAMDTGTNGKRRLWTRAPKAAAAFTDASAACAALSVDNVTSGWRLPSYDELALLLQNPSAGCATCNPAIDQAAFPATAKNEFEWTNSLAAAGSYYLVDFCAGTKTSGKQTDSHTFRCTHDPM